MAGIDKTYTDSYKDYKEFKDWADKQKLTCLNPYFCGRCFLRVKSISICICAS